MPSSTQDPFHSHCHGLDFDSSRLLFDELLQAFRCASAEHDTGTLPPLHRIRQILQALACQWDEVPQSPLEEHLKAFTDYAIRETELYAADRRRETLQTLTSLIGDVAEAWTAVTAVLDDARWHLAAHTGHTRVVTLSS